MAIVETVQRMQRWALGIKAALSNAEFVLSNQIREDGKTVAIDVSGVTPDFGAVRAHSIWSPSGFVGPGFSQYVYWSWEEERYKCSAQLGLIPLSSLGLNERKHKAMKHHEWNAQFTQGVVRLFSSEGWESGHIMLHELAHLHQARKVSPRAFGRAVQASDAVSTFEHRRWAYLPEQFADLVSGVSVAIQEHRSSTWAEWVQTVKLVHDINTGKPAGSRLRKHQLRRLAQLWARIRDFA